MKNYLIGLLMVAGTAVSAQVQTDYYSNGVKRSEGAFAATAAKSNKVVLASDGSSRPDPSQTKTGKWEYWYDSGVKSAEENYTSGSTSGTWKTWYPAGLQSSEINYTTGKATFWYPNGKKQSEGMMLVNRVFDGKWTFWFDSGVKNGEGNYVGGKKDGVWKWYDSTGKQISTETYNMDALIDSQKQ